MITSLAKMGLLVLAMIACTDAILWASDPVKDPLPPAADRPVAEVVALIGKVMVTRADEKTSVPLGVSEVLYERDRILTPAASKVRIRFADDTVVTLGELASLELTTAKVKMGKDGRQVTLTIASGWFRSTVQRLMDQESFVLRTPTAVGAVRGTEFGAVVKLDSTGVFVKQGKVVVSHRDAAIQGDVTLTDGDGTDVGVGQPPTPPKKWGPARVNALMEATEVR
jgi:hypothetical protein